MNGLLKLNKPGPCLTLFESACADQGSAALMENVQLYTTAITAAATLGDHERALELVSRMTFAGVKPNIKTLTSLMGACLSGENYNYALEVYKKIDKPDGLAMMFGVRAQSEMRDFDSAINIVDGNKEMSGKQVMSSYNYIITCALKEKNYDAAQNAMDNLLKNNYIPSKITFMKILDGLGMRMSKEKRAAVFGNQSDDESEDIEKFKYLLSVLDSIEKRKLYCTGQMYSCILSEGARLGGLYKKIASLINKSHTDETHLKVQVQQEEVPKYDVDLRWRDLLENYSNYKSSLDKIELPPIRVRINQKEIRQVLIAEQRVTYGAIRKNTKRNFAQSKR
jgi:pentatricopeptide repeat protein